MTTRKRKKTGPQIVISDNQADRWWKWSGRVCLVLMPIFVGLWWVFGWYNGVEGLKNNVNGLAHRVEAMWQGQTSVMQDQEKLRDGQKAVDESLNRIEQTVAKAKR